MELLLQMEVPRKPPHQKNAKVKEKNSLRRKAAAEDSSRKTYTATLAARSKAACGIAATILSIIMYGSPHSKLLSLVPCLLYFVHLINSLYLLLCVEKSFPDGSGKMVGVDGKPSGEDIQLGIRMGQNQSKEDLV
nr:bidirectional sugar transporter SWEET1-like [Ipomoea batatas]